MRMSLPLSVSDFTGLDVSSGIKVVVTPADAFSVSARRRRRPTICMTSRSCRDGRRAPGLVRLEHLAHLRFRPAQHHPARSPCRRSRACGQWRCGRQTRTRVPGDELRVDVSGGAHAAIDAASAKRYAMALSAAHPRRSRAPATARELDTSGGATLDASDLGLRRSRRHRVGRRAPCRLGRQRALPPTPRAAAHIEVHGHPPQTTVNSSSGGGVSFAN